MAGVADDFERAAGGMDFDGDLGERAKDLGRKIADGGPGAILDELEELLPEPWRDQVASFPLTAVLIGFGAGLWLGMRKGDIILAAAAAMISTAATQNVNQILEKVGAPQRT
jgi:hypothetical protein